jgi:hypothetical protein
LGDLSSGEGLLQKHAAEAQALTLDAMADALGYVPFDGKAQLGELLAGNEHGINWDDLVHVAMHQQDRGCRSRLLRQRLHIGKRAGIADDRRRRRIALKPHRERHHGSLAEADQCERSG